MKNKCRSWQEPMEIMFGVKTETQISGTEQIAQNRPNSIKQVNVQKDLTASERKIL